MRAFMASFFYMYSTFSSETKAIMYYTYTLQG